MVAEPMVHGSRAPRGTVAATARRGGAPGRTAVRRTAPSAVPTPFCGAGGPQMRNSTRQHPERREEPEPFDVVGVQCVIDRSTLGGWTPPSDIPYGTDPGAGVEDDHRPVIEVEHDAGGLSAVAGIVSGPGEARVPRQPQIVARTASSPPGVAPRTPRPHRGSRHAVGTEECGHLDLAMCAVAPGDPDRAVGRASFPERDPEGELIQGNGRPVQIGGLPLARPFAGWEFPGFRVRIDRAPARPLH